MLGVELKTVVWVLAGSRWSKQHTGWPCQTLVEIELHVEVQKVWCQSLNREEKTRHLCRDQKESSQTRGPVQWCYLPSMKSFNPMENPLAVPGGSFPGPVGYTECWFPCRVPAARGFLLSDVTRSCWTSAGHRSLAVPESLCTGFLHQPEDAYQNWANWEHTCLAHWPRVSPLQLAALFFVFPEDKVVASHLLTSPVQGAIDRAGEKQVPLSFRPVVRIRHWLSCSGDSLKPLPLDQSRGVSGFRDRVTGSMKSRGSAIYNTLYSRGTKNTTSDICDSPGQVL